MPKKKTLQEFIENSIKIHGDRYDYSKCNYKGNKIKVEIVCKEHGSFFQSPNDHIGGHGCRKCSEENTLNYNLKEAYSEKNKDLPLDFYVLDITRKQDRFLKVGISREFSKRVINIKVKSKAVNISPLLILPCTLHEATILEDKVIKNLKKNYRKFFSEKFTGYSECLTYEAKESILEEIKNFMTENHRSDLVGKILDYEYGK